MTLGQLFVLLFAAFAIPVSIVLCWIGRLIHRAFNDWITRNAIRLEFRRMTEVRGRRVR